MSGLLKTPIIVTRVLAIVSVGHGADETLRQGLDRLAHQLSTPLRKIAPTFMMGRAGGFGEVQGLSSQSKFSSSSSGLHSLTFGILFRISTGCSCPPSVTISNLVGKADISSI